MPAPLLLLSKPEPYSCLLIAKHNPLLICLSAGECYRADHLLEGKLEALLEDSKAPLPPDQTKVSIGWLVGACS